MFVFPPSGSQGRWINKLKTAASPLGPGLRQQTLEGIHGALCCPLGVTGRACGWLVFGRPATEPLVTLGSPSADEQAGSQPSSPATSRAEEWPPADSLDAVTSSFVNRWLSVKSRPPKTQHLPCAKHCWALGCVPTRVVQQMLCARLFSQVLGSYQWAFVGRCLPFLCSFLQPIL